VKKLIIFIASLLFACSSNCIECHPKLKPLENNPKNRYYAILTIQALKSCVKCHKSEKINDLLHPQYTIPLIPAK